ncbi:F-box/WD repeat-containing protein 9 isoform X2 [Nilaparvata lugens]|uniref:F-box/WD repeat-containing protein 9 isoform X2 n=1 Tax=Nilaparvata lugens TaxID=108931 RepID=UPI00193E3DDD|nr:F-box/WD repeat-containing protein 9 isoform X2 [Nilaparvata lugens]
MNLIFLYICSFIDAKHVADCLRYVCTRFYEVLSSDTAWKCRLRERCPNMLPAVDYVDDEPDWLELCYQIESELQLWKRERDKMSKISWSVDSCIDAVKLIDRGKRVISGSRNRDLQVWDVDSRQLQTSIILAHAGWIWDLAIDNDKLYSCSWDSSISMRDLTDNLREINSYKCSAAVLSIVCREGLLVGGLFKPEVVAFDPRQKEPIFSYNPHRAAVTGLALVGDNYLVSASEDKSIAVWDLRTREPVNENIVVSCDNSFPLSIYYNNNLLYVGDTRANVHIISTNNGVFEKKVSCHLESAGQAKLTSIWHGLGCIIVGSTDKSVKIFQPSQPLDLICELSVTGEVTSIDYDYSTLAIGSSASVEVWKTTDTFDT